MSNYDRWRLQTPEEFFGDGLECDCPCEDRTAPEVIDHDEWCEFPTEPDCGCDRCECGCHDD